MASTDWLRRKPKENHRYALGCAAQERPAIIRLVIAECSCINAGASAYNRGEDDKVFAVLLVSGRHPAGVAGTYKSESDAGLRAGELAGTSKTRKRSGRMRELRRNRESADDRKTSHQKGGRVALRRCSPLFLYLDRKWF